MRRLVVPVLLLLSVVACAEEDAGDTVIQGVTSTSAGSTSLSSGTVTSSSSSPSTTPFDGATTPTSIASTASAVALLTAVGTTAQDGTERVTFTFRDEVPGLDAQYVQPPITEDASGEEVEVEGSAFLSVRFEPASSYDMEAGAPTYDGPERITADLGAIAELVRTGDFEANLTWVIGLREEVPFRVETSGSTVSIVVRST